MGTIQEATTRMDLAGDRLLLEQRDNARYAVALPCGSHLILIAGMKGPPPAHFHHANILAAIPQIQEVKRYPKHRCKKWYAYAGTDFYIAMPKTEIHLIHEPGYSYVPVRIGTQRYYLNVTGGGDSDRWTDFVGSVVHLGIGFQQKQLFELARHAAGISEVEALKLPTIPIPTMSEGDRERYRLLIARKLVNDFLRKAEPQTATFYLDRKFSYEGSKGPFVLEENHLRYRGRHMRGRLGLYGRFEFGVNHVDVLRTAEANGIPLPDPQPWIHPSSADFLKLTDSR